MPAAQEPSLTSSQAAGPVRVFISYSHDSPEHRARVLALAQRLRSDGVDCWLDRFVVAPPEGWPRWTVAQVEQARFVLLVCTATYGRRFLGQEAVDQGQGVVWEASYILNDLYRSGTQSSRYVPVFFPGDAGQVPGPVGHLSRYDLDAEYEQLYRRLTDQPEVQPAEVGSVRRLAPLAVLPTQSAGVTGPLVHVNPVATRQQELADRLDAAQAAREERLRQGGEATELEQEILELRREQRAVGLQAGERLGDGGRYEVREPIGQGGFAVVWRAYDHKLRQQVALKILHLHLADQSRKERFFRGARWMAKLTHPGIVPVYEPRCEEGGLCWFVMEYLPGGDLRRAVAEGRIRPTDALPLCLQVGAALQYAHEQDPELVHRDIKPANILLDRQGRPKLTDFDLVRAGDTTGGTKTGALGTFVYAAPEAMDQAHGVKQQADLYSLAMTAVFVLHGQDPPFFELIRNPADFLARLPCTGEQQQVLLRALELKPAARWGSVREFCQALEDAGRVPEGGRVAEPVGRASPPVPQAVAEPAGRASPPVPQAVAEPAGRVSSPVPNLAVPSINPHDLLHGPEPRLEKLARLQAAVRATRDLPTLQLLGAAMLALGADAAPLEEARQQVGRALALGILERPWPEIPAGEFWMGSPEDEEGRYPDEGPRHRVRLLRPFHLLATPVTQALYQVVSGHNPSGFSDDLRLPVERVTWHDAMAFCTKLSLLLERPVRLPREAEWEYACRAGTTTRYWSGDAEEDLARVAWYKANSDDRTHPVGEKPCNPWGLYDLHGNVWEWCHDPWVGSYQGREHGVTLDPAEVPDPGERGVGRVVRGGCWSYSARLVRSAYRSGDDPRNQWLNRGFRVLLPPSQLPALGHRS